MRVINGELEAYWEQGWEGHCVEFAFQFDGNAQRLSFCRTASVFTIFDADGSVLWSGEIRFVKRRFFDKHQLMPISGPTSEVKGVSYADWMDWFWRKPPLKAKLNSINDRLIRSPSATQGGQYSGDCVVMPRQGTEFDELLPGQMSRQSREGRVAHISPHDELSTPRIRVRCRSVSPLPPDR